MMTQGKGYSKCQYVIGIVGHRVYMWDIPFKKQTLNYTEVKDKIQKLSVLSHCNNPHNLEGIVWPKEVFPLPNPICVFDTALSSFTMPVKAKKYASARI